MEEEREYIGPYKVTKVFFKSARRVVIERGLTKEQAMRLCKSYPNSMSHHVGFNKQFSSDKYFKPKK